MTDTLLLATNVPRGFAATLAERYEVLGPVEQPFQDTAKALRPDQAARVRAIVAIGAVRLPAAAMDLFPNLGLISCLGSGYEGADLAAARERGIAVTHSPDSNAAAVADLAMALLISSIRDLTFARDYLRSGRWKGNAGERMPSVRGLTGRKVGIFGMGVIGLKIARRATAFDMDIAYHNRKPRADVDYAYCPSLHALATWADVLVVAVRADTGNRHAVDGAVLKALGPDGFVINIARGFVVDEAALLDALRAGTIRGAGLDVFEHEPQVPAALFELPHVTLTPHIGGNTNEAQQAMHDMVLANLNAFFAGRPVPNPVPNPVPA